MHIPEGSCAAEKTNNYSIISDIFRKYLIQKDFLNAVLYEKYLTTGGVFFVQLLTSAEKRKILMIKNLNQAWIPFFQSSRL